MAQNLQKQCPFLGLLRENDLHLVDLLISDKKLVEEIFFLRTLLISWWKFPAELNIIFLDIKPTTDSEKSREHR